MMVIITVIIVIMRHGVQGGLSRVRDQQKGRGKMERILG
jgi:hypothetical protein